MSDPAEEFRKLAMAVGDMRQEVAAALDRSAPDYRRDLAQIFTTLQTIEKKPALQTAPGALERSAAVGATQGAADASKALREALSALNDAKQLTESHAGVVESLSWKWTAAILALVLLSGIAFGALFSLRLFPSSLMATEPGCRLVGGTHYPPNPAKNTGSACVFYGGQ